jgi:hypothetical protein
LTGKVVELPGYQTVNLDDRQAVGIGVAGSLRVRCGLASGLGIRLEGAGTIDFWTG